MAGGKKEPPFPTEHVKLPAWGDGYALAATVVRPKKAASHAVVIAPATAVPRVYYMQFMWFLASQGVGGVTFDWRGAHGSLPGRDHTTSTATLTQWASMDLPAAIELARKAFPEATLVLVGHSVGGHVMPLAPNIGEISHALTVGTQNAYYPLTPFRYRYGYLWNVMVPASTQMFGYYPGSKLRIIGEVPTSIMLEWKSWATHPLYARGRHLPEGTDGDTTEDLFMQFKQPVLAVSLDDDEFATEKAVHLFHEMLGSEVVHWHISHGSLPGMPQIKHVGFFSPRHAKTLWPVALQWILEKKANHEHLHKPDYVPEYDEPATRAKL